MVGGKKVGWPASPSKRYPPRPSSVCVLAAPGRRGGDSRAAPTRANAHAAPENRRSAHRHQGDSLDKEGAGRAAFLRYPYGYGEGRVPLLNGLHKRGETTETAYRFSEVPERVPKGRRPAAVDSMA